MTPQHRALIPELAPHPRRGTPQLGRTHALEALRSGVIAGIDPAPARAAALREWAVRYWEALHPHSTGGGYVNFLGTGESEGRVRATYRGHHDRLAEIKRSYDPHNLFHANQNIEPAPAHRP
ncbi:BBE domain-containing protein [Streptomyces sp. NPDC102441]|uniref:BBE domain-containing protein n=1 Tax=Streptomyces sp. NPDC102441 TaxID=3366176 RepID=UPI003825445B